MMADHDWLAHLDPCLWLGVLLDWLPSCITHIHPVLRSPQVGPIHLPLHPAAHVLLLLPPSFPSSHSPSLYQPSLFCFMYLFHHIAFSCSHGHLPSCCLPSLFPYFSCLPSSSPAVRTFLVNWYVYPSFPLLCPLSSQSCSTRFLFFFLLHADNVKGWICGDIYQGCVLPAVVTTAGEKEWKYNLHRAKNKAGTWWFFFCFAGDIWTLCMCVCNV